MCALWAKISHSAAIDLVGFEQINGSCFQLAVGAMVDGPELVVATGASLSRLFLRAAQAIRQSA